jgi:phenol 2-monooxygenase (NADPH)
MIYSLLVKERLARSYFSPGGRIVLAGDAAHVHAVNGGQGLNTGISDAFALVWRLYLGTKGYESLIKTYELERRHIAADVLSVAAKLVRSTLRTATEYVEIVEKNAAYITGKF